MKPLRAESLDFLERAPKRWTFEAPVAATPDAVFAAISADPATWANWFPGFSDGGYEGDGPYGVGTRRHVTVGRTRYRETMVVWEAPTRWTYRVDETTVRLANALIEDWTIEAAGTASIVRWTFAIEPTALFRLFSPLAPIVMGRLFRRAMANLSRQLTVGGIAL